MTNTDLNTLEDYVRAIADEMGLRDWEIRIECKKVKIKGSVAEQNYIYGRKIGVITFGKGAMTERPEELRQTICHELVHFHMTPMWDSSIRDLGGLMDGKTYDVWVEGLRRNMEYATDALADAIAPRMPLIEWTPSK